MAVPWSLEVQRFTETRAPELQSLIKALQSSGNALDSSGNERGLASIAEVPRNLKRRTRSHNRRKQMFWSQNKKAKKSKKAAAIVAEVCEEVQEGENAGSKAAAKKREMKIASLSRRVRRRIEFQGVAQGKGSCCRDGTQRLVTHVWHAKRFSMSKLWGYWLPIGIPGKGRGARSILKAADDGVLLHDSSYYSAIQLEGPRTEIAGVLNLVLEPFSASSSSKDSGYVSAMAHHCGKLPFSPIAPVTVIFYPTRNTDGSMLESLWIWVHASAFDEALKSLQTACEQGKFTGTCRSRRGELARLEVFGKNAFHLLQKVLKARPASGASVLLRHFLSGNEKRQNNVFLPAEVYDPREVPLFKSDDGSTEDSTGVSMEEENIKSFSSWQSFLDQQATFEHNKSPLWGPVEDLEAPSREEAVNKKQQRHRLHELRLSDAEEADPSTWKGCSIFLLKHDYHSGFSIILPMTWVHAFWMPLVVAGARVIGQRERRWLMTHMDVSSFPYDYPDCAAYKELADLTHQEQLEMNERKPPQKRLPSVFHLAWIDPGFSSTAEDTASVSDDPKVFFGFVARSHILLSSFLRLHGLRSFPGAVDHQKPTDEHVLEMLASQKACYSRVMIRPARKGVIEEGSVLYAPESDDFRTWQERSHDWQGIDFGAGLRRAIGFVTTAAPWRSRDAAIGFCDVSEFCKQMQNAKGLLLLFHNSRSSKLRPALATIDM